MPVTDDQVSSMVRDILSEKSAPKTDAASLAKSLLEGNKLAAAEMLEADFDTENFAPKALRWSLARGDTVEEKRLRIKKKYPKGDVRVLPESTVLGFDEDTIVWRENEQSQWKMIEPQGFEWADLGMDVAEALAPSAEAIVAETAMAFGSGGASVPITVGRQALGALAGEAVEQGIQYATGTQSQSLGEVGMEVGSEGAWSAAGGFAMSPLVAAKNIATGRGALRIGDEGLDIINAAKDIDPEIAEKLTPALVTDNPALRLSEAQSAALLPGLNLRYRELVDMLDKAVKGSINQPAASKAKDRVISGLKDFGNFFLKRIKNAGTTLSEGGNALKEGVEQYSKVSRTIVSGLYDAARKIEEPVLDLDAALKIGSDLRAGSKGIIDPRVDAQIKALEEIKGPITLSDGSVLSVTDQIRNVRTGLNALAHVEPGKVADQTTGQATDLRRGINEMLENPKNTSSSFRDAWKSANDAAKERFKTLEMAPVIAAAKSQNPADLVRTYARPYQSDHLLAIRNTVSKEKWGEFVDSAVAELLADPSNLAKNLDAFDKETLDALMPAVDSMQLRKIGSELSRINRVGADKIAEQQISNRNFIDTLISEADPRTIQTVMRAANNTNNKALRESFRAAVLEWTWNGVIKKGKKLTIDDALLADRVKQLKRKEIWRYLSPDERKIIGNAEVVSKAFHSVIDAGTSIQAAEAVQGLKKLQMNAIMTFIRSEMVAQFYLSGMGRRMLIGSGLPNSNGSMLRLLGGALAQTAPPEDISALETDKIHLSVADKMRAQ